MASNTVRVSKSEHLEILEPNEVPESDGLVNGSKTNSSQVREVVLKGRIRRKARRLAKLSISESSSSSGESTNGTLNKFRKNSRKSRNGFGRGLPKKGGAGGKGTWGELGIELNLDDNAATDVHDPNYDSESQDSCEFEAIEPEITLEDLEKTVEPTIHEYFEHGSTVEVLFTLCKFNLGKLQPQIVNLIISLAMERKPSHCEMTSVLLSDLYGRLLSQDDIAAGFDILLTSLTDTILDTPDAPTILGNFIARAVADDCLPPKFVHSYKEKMECPYGRAALEHADALLNMKHGMVRLDNVWGVGGGMRPVTYLINQMQLLLKEYLSSGDSTEAFRCLQELEVPHFHHEIVYEAIIMVIEDMKERTMDLICKLLYMFATSVIVTPDQIVQGFLRVYDDMPEINIDVPQAYIVLEKFVNKCQKAGFLPDEVVIKMPSRGRKRFVSEGDGGLVKID